MVIYNRKWGGDDTERRIDSELRSIRSVLMQVDSDQRNIMPLILFSVALSLVAILVSICGR